MTSAHDERTLTRDQLLPASSECTTVNIGNSGSGRKKVPRHLRAAV
jgi:hypothetical protein